MNDFEDRLVRALRSAADRAPEPGDFSPRRRSRATVLLAVAAVLVAVAVPFGLVRFLATSGSHQPPVVDSSSSATPSATTRTSVPAGWRVESFNNVTLLVPATWWYGNVLGWCAGGLSSDQSVVPVIERPAMVSTGGGCKPQLGYGVIFSARSPVGFYYHYGRMSRQPGTVFRQITLGKVRVTILTPDTATADRIAASVHVYEGADPNGCPATVTVPPLGKARGTTGGLAAGEGSVCWYFEGPPGAVRTGMLYQSERLTGSQTQQAIAALEAAPQGSGPDRPKMCAEPLEGQAVMLSFGTHQVWVHYDHCVGHGIDGVGDSTRKLTADVLYWALQPGWTGGLVDGVPVPHPFRTR